MGSGETKRNANQVSVYGSGLSEPLLKSNDVRLVQIRDEKGDPMAMLVKLTSKLWGFTSRGDADWENHVRNLSIDD